MSRSDNEAVEIWLARLDDLQPVDGNLTDDVMAAVGSFPVERPPGDAFDNRNDPAKSHQYHRGTVARRVAFEMAKHRAMMANAKSDTADEGSAEKYRLNAEYWSQISSWLKTRL